MKVRVEKKIADRVLAIETGHLAKQADGAVLVSYGDCVVLATAVAVPDVRGVDFFPLSVEYREKQYAAGQFPGGIIKREGRPTNKEILTCRLIDRPLRPLFPKGYHDEVQIYADAAGTVDTTIAVTLSDAQAQAIVTFFNDFRPHTRDELKALLATTGVTVPDTIPSGVLTNVFVDFDPQQLASILP